MSVPSAPGADFAMVEPEIVHGALETCLDGPTQPNSTSEFGKCRSFGCENEVIGSLIGGLTIAPDQNPTLEIWRTDPWQRNPRPVIPPQPPPKITTAAVTRAT